eukprot:gene2747-4361_t
MIADADRAASVDGGVDEGVVDGAASPDPAAAAMAVLA